MVDKFKLRNVASAVQLQPTTEYCCRWGIHCLSCPELQPNKNLKVQDKNEKPNRITSAETAGDNELQPKITTSSRTCSNTHVVCCSSSFSINILVWYQGLCIFKIQFSILQVQLFIKVEFLLTKRNSLFVKMPSSNIVQRHRLN